MWACEAQIPRGGTGFKREQMPLNETLSVVVSELKIRFKNQAPT